MLRLLLSLLLLIGTSAAAAQARPAFPLPPATNPTCFGTAIAAGNATIGTALSAGTTNQTFCLAAGSFTGNSSVSPKAGQVLWGVSPESTIIDGGLANAFFVNNGAGSGVTFRSLSITNYTSRCVAGFSTTNQTYLNVNFSNCGGTGTGTGLLALEAGVGTRVIGGRYHHNGNYGILVDSSAVANNTIIVGAEIDHNNLACNTNADSGATKVADATGVKFINNNVHDNCYSGIWYDIASNQMIVAGNKVINNTQANGIWFEISGDDGQVGSGAGTCTIHDNIVTGNEGAAIFASNGSNCDVGNNFIDSPAAISGGTASGFTSATNVFSDASRTGSFCPTGCKAISNLFHDNTIIMRGTPAGWLGNGYGYDSTGSQNGITAGLAWTHNTYYVPSGGCTGTSFFLWEPGRAGKTFAQWQALPQDATGTCNTTTPPAPPW